MGGKSHKLDLIGGVLRQTHLGGAAAQHLCDDPFGRGFERLVRGVEIDGLAMNFGPFLPRGLGQPGQGAGGGIDRVGQAVQAERPVQPGNRQQRRTAAGPMQAKRRAGSANQAKRVLHKGRLLARGRGQDDQPRDVLTRFRRCRFFRSDQPDLMSPPDQLLADRIGQRRALTDQPDLTPGRDRCRLSPVRCRERNHAGHQALERARDGNSGQGLETLDGAERKLGSRLWLYRDVLALDLRFRLWQTRLRTEEVDDLAESPQRAEVLGFDRRCLGQPVLQRREDLHPLDRVDPQVGVELHVQLEHLDRVSRLLRHDLQQDLGHAHGWGRG